MRTRSASLSVASVSFGLMEILINPLALWRQIASASHCGVSPYCLSNSRSSFKFGHTTGGP